MRRFQLFNAQVSGVLNAAMAFLPRLHSETPYHPVIPASPASDLYAKIRELPRIQQAIAKEGEKWCRLECVEPRYLNAFLTDDKLYQYYERGCFEFQHFLAYPDGMINFFDALSHAPERNVDEILQGKYGSIRFFSKLFAGFSKSDIAHFFNPGFIQLLQSGKIELESPHLNWHDHSNEGWKNRGKIIALSELFDSKKLVSFINDGYIPIDKMLSLKEQDLRDLRTLFYHDSLDDYNLRHWIDENYFTMDQFLACERKDRKRYIAFMECRKIPCEYFTLSYFLSLKSATRENYDFRVAYDGKRYMTIEKFDTFSEELVKQFPFDAFTEGLMKKERNHYDLYLRSCIFLLTEGHVNYESLCELINGVDKHDILYWVPLAMYWDDHGGGETRHARELLRTLCKSVPTVVATKVSLQLNEHVNFLAIDSRIRQNPRQQQNNYPQTVTVYIPEEFLEEITAKLKNHAHITEVTVGGKQLKRDETHFAAEPKAPKSRFFSKPKRHRNDDVEIRISSFDPINLADIDQRIKQIHPWMLRSPTSVHFSVPKECVDEVMKKLKAHREILSINGESTSFGWAVADSFPQFRKIK